MSVTKEKILHTIELMDDDDAVFVLDWLNNNFIIKYKKTEWDSIGEIEPDEIDLEMMADIEMDPDCHEFVFEEELITRRKGVVL